MFSYDVIGNFRFENKNEVPTILMQMASQSTTSTEIDRIEKFAKENKLENIKTALENAKLNLKWADNNVPIIKDTIKQIEQ